MSEVSGTGLRLWLPKFHTPSLNVTTGRHWSVYYAHKQKAAAALLDALPGPQGSKAHLVLDAIKKGGKAGSGNAAMKKLALRASAQARRSVDLSKRAKSRLRYVRVTCQPLDDENFVGSTKALTDCLRAAFPALLPDDAPGWVIMEHEQERCETHDEEGTWVILSEGQP